MPNYISDPYASFAGIVTFSPEEISAALTSSIIVILPTILLMLLFRKAVKGTDEQSKNPSRFDKVVQEAAEEGRIILPEKSYTRPLRPGEGDGNGNRKVEGGWPGYCYFIGWALTVLFIREQYSLLSLFIYHIFSFGHGHGGIIWIVDGKQQNLPMGDCNGCQLLLEYFR